MIPPALAAMSGMPTNTISAEVLKSEILLVGERMPYSVQFFEDRRRNEFMCGHIRMLIIQGETSPPRSASRLPVPAHPGPTPNLHPNLARHFELARSRFHHLTRYMLHVQAQCWSELS